VHINSSVKLAYILGLLLILCTVMDNGMVALSVECETWDQEVIRSTRAPPFCAIYSHLCAFVTK